MPGEVEGAREGAPAAADAPAVDRGVAKPRVQSAVVLKSTSRQPSRGMRSVDVDHRSEHREKGRRSGDRTEPSQTGSWNAPPEGPRFSEHDDRTAAVGTVVDGQAHVMGRGGGAGRGKRIVGTPAGGDGTTAGCREWTATSGAMTNLRKRSGTAHHEGGAWTETVQAAPTEQTVQTVHPPAWATVARAMAVGLVADRR
eukprot:CAMPEP_0182922470 /NCGR_PEP_ID=MMETSP0105_2-20130417/4821_1 /TAXON_ID=81532 ORGANISM="Acanthoeca-like sp., Strain 10tr" /NCGR_SAMPLE_ID=MMETSP0105_2 /ASSEMBLY_ACC=CAM_ASM_000205 /LENGTH=197 /DNA_ID=CAMNT_0025060089 /DNA_START=59 /DNA_END=650 /DNA_ORIENTATION=-